MVNIQQAIEAALHTLTTKEVIVCVRLAYPELVSHADYFTRFKIYIAELDNSGTQSSKKRCIVVRISSNSNVAEISSTTKCEAIPDLG